MAAKLALITGGNTGLGYEIVKALVQSSKSYTILLCGRSIQKAQDAIKELQSEFPNSQSTLSALQVDIEDDDSIKKAFEEVSSKYGKLDILINNAGAQYGSSIDWDDLSSIRKAWNRTWDVNVSGTHIMTYVFAPLLLKGDDARLIFMASGTATLAGTEPMDGPIYSRLNGPPPAGWPKPEPNTVAPYRSSKTGMNMMMREWYKTLRNDGVKVFAISPGFLATGLAGGDEKSRAQMKAQGAQDPALGGNFVKEVVEGARDDDVGKVVRWYATPVQPW
ncbi:NAD(P)-binding protein [Rhizodiscina lignyota]|uniref:NAD(P)-binding protein n=1 Tax=Rhizodiscina lignyota TaxID=1504668 RepID=A0A9P4M7P8_9PEZI|nr:NAD(P)-binding protein [Rhizodiscina lignyota]